MILSDCIKRRSVSWHLGTFRRFKTTTIFLCLSSLSTLTFMSLRRRSGIKRFVSSTSLSSPESLWGASNKTNSKATSISIWCAVSSMRDLSGVLHQRVMIVKRLRSQNNGSNWAKLTSLAFLISKIFWHLWSLKNLVMREQKFLTTWKSFASTLVLCTWCSRARRTMQRSLSKERFRSLEITKTSHLKPQWIWSLLLCRSELELSLREKLQFLSTLPGTPLTAKK